MSAKTKPKPKIGPLTVWVVGHPQNPLLLPTLPTNDDTGPLAVFYKQKDARAWKKKHGSIYTVQKATVLRDGTGPDYKWQAEDLASQLALERTAIKNLQDELAKSKRAHAETEQRMLDIQKAIHEGKIWSTENPRWTPRTQSALALAAKEAEACGATYVGTEHLLLGLLRQEEGIARRHFLACGMTYEKAEYALRVGRHS